jgi:hypothetical protein
LSVIHREEMTLCVYPDLPLQRQFVAMAVITSARWQLARVPMLSFPHSLIAGTVLGFLRDV